MREPLLTVEELAGWLRVAPGTIRNMVSARRIPVVHVGRRCLFDPAEIGRWLEAGTQREREPAARRLPVVSRARRGGRAP